MSWYAQVGRFSQGGCVSSALVIPAIKVVYIFLFFNFTVPPAVKESSGFPHLNYLQHLKEAIHDLRVFGNLLRCTHHLLLSWYKSRDALDGCSGCTLYMKHQLLSRHPLHHLQTLSYVRAWVGTEIPELPASCRCWWWPQIVTSSHSCVYNHG